MSTTRADLITQSKRKIDTYSDFHNNFAKHPITNQLVILHNEDAVRQAFKNLVLTNLYERFFNPFFGTNITASIFELDTPFLLQDLQLNIALSAKQFEPRVTLLSITLDDNPDTNGIGLNITFQTVNNPTPIVLPILLNRVR